MNAIASTYSMMSAEVLSLAWQKVDWKDATSVRPKTGDMRFAIPVRLEGGGRSFDISQHPQKGGWTLAKGMGMTFKNPVDNSMQGVQGDGSGLLIVNGVNQFKATQIMSLISEMGGMQTIGTIDRFAELIRGIGVRAGSPDIYNSDLGWLEKNTVQNPKLLDSSLTFQMDERLFGFLPKTGELSSAYFVSGEIRFAGSRGQNHSLVAPIGVIMKLASMIKVNAAGEPDEKGGNEVPDIYASQIAPFVGAYVLADGTEITMENFAEMLAHLVVSV